MFTFIQLKQLNPLSAKLTKWPNTLKHIVGNLPTNYLSVFGHFMGLALKELTISKIRHFCGTPNLSGYALPLDGIFQVCDVQYVTE